MNTLVKGFKTLLMKIENAKRPQTKQKYQDKLIRRMEISLEKTWNDDLLLQEKRLEKRQRKREVRLEKQLNAALKRQKKLEKERKVMDSKLKKLKREKELRSRLLSKDEIDSMVDDIDNGTFTDEQKERLNAHVQEEKRLKKMLRKQGKEIRDTRKRVKLNKKFEYLNDILKKVDVKRPTVLRIADRF